MLEIPIAQQIEVHENIAHFNCIPLINNFPNLPLTVGGINRKDPLVLMKKLGVVDNSFIFVIHSGRVFN